MEKKKVLLLGFGGTIAMLEKDGVLKPAKTIEEILNLVPLLHEQADLTLEQLENLDSTNINPTHWSKLAIRISEVWEKFDGIIITHGTDTMAYTSSAISFALGRGIKIPIIFTGSQLPLASFGTDAKFNLENSMKAIIFCIEQRINEVMIVFSEKILRASRSIKISDSSFGAFDSPGFPNLGIITATGINDSSVFQKIDETVFDLKPHFNSDILVIELNPGLKPSLINCVLRSGTCQGLLLKSLGVGNIPFLDEYSLVPVIKEAVDLKIPVLISTKFVGGKTHMEIYESGKVALDAGAIPTGDMTDVSAQVKFMWLLAQGFRRSEELKKMINTNFIGEISA